MSRLSKKMMALLLTGVMTMSLAACGSSGSTETGSSSGSTTTPAASTEASEGGS